VCIQQREREREIERERERDPLEDQVTVLTFSNLLFSVLLYYVELDRYFIIILSGAIASLKPTPSLHRLFRARSISASEWATNGRLTGNNWTRVVIRQPGVSVIL